MTRTEVIAVLIVPFIGLGIMAGQGFEFTWWVAFFWGTAILIGIVYWIATRTSHGDGGPVLGDIAPIANPPLPPPPATSTGGMLAARDTRFVRDYLDALRPKLEFLVSEHMTARVLQASDLNVFGSPLVLVFRNAPLAMKANRVVARLEYHATDGSADADITIPTGAWLDEYRNAVDVLPAMSVRLIVVVHGLSKKAFAMSNRSDPGPALSYAHINERIDKRLLSKDKYELRVTLSCSGYEMSERFTLERKNERFEAGHIRRTA